MDIQVSPPAPGTVVTFMVDGEKISGKFVRLSDDRSRVYVEVADDGFNQHISYPVTSVMDDRRWKQD